MPEENTFNASELFNEEGGLVEGIAGKLYEEDDAGEMAKFTKKFENQRLSTVLKSHHELEKKLGNPDILRKNPYGEKVDESALKEYRRVNGVPEKAEEYKIEIGEEFSKKLQEDESLKSYYDNQIASFHKYNVPQEAVNNIVKNMLDFNVDTDEKINALQLEQENKDKAVIESMAKDRGINSELINKVLAAGLQDLNIDSESPEFKYADPKVKMALYDAVKGRIEQSIPGSKIQSTLTDLGSKINEMINDPRYKDPKLRDERFVQETRDLIAQKASLKI